MTYFPELALIKYWSPLHHGDWDCPAYSVGWLESGEAYPMGTVSVQGFWDKLRYLSSSMLESIASHGSFRGLHSCSLCENDGKFAGEARLDGSHANIFVPGADCVYIAPGRVDHYIEVHNYLPPEEFVTAVMDCPDPTSPDYRAALIKANLGHETPFCKSERILEEAKTYWLNKKRQPTQ